MTKKFSAFSLLDQLTLEEAKHMACTVNDEGLLPIDLCFEGIEKDKAIIHLLLPIMLNKTFKPLSTLINTEAVLRKYNDTVAVLLTFHLKKEIDDKINQMRVKRTTRLKQQLGESVPDSLTSKEIRIIMKSF